jgi:hypothetical protein
MKYMLTLLMLLGGITTAEAYELYVTEVTEPYEIVPLQAEAGQKQVYVGTLEDFPVMYEVVVSATTTLTAQLSQRRQGEVPRNLALMIVRNDDQGGGVTEVGRLTPGAAEWGVRKDGVFGMTFWESTVFAEEVGPGTYRVEVSTPDNQGPYMLTVGEVDGPAGYFKTLGMVYTTQKVFGSTFLGMLRSTYVYYPLGIMLLLFALWRTWKSRKEIAHVA